MDTAAPISPAPAVAPSPAFTSVVDGVETAALRLKQNIINMPRTSVVVAALAGIGLYALITSVEHMAKPPRTVIKYKPVTPGA